jgi:ABC-2 type transport system ATP-binding protein
MPTEKIISVQNITKYFGQTVAVNDASFEVGEGEIFGFLGPNGAGKTTTIRLMLDLLRPDAGTIQIFGMNLQSNSIAIRKRCGYLPGEFTAFKNLTAMEFLKMGAYLRKNDAFEFLALAKRFDLTEHELHRKIKYLSHGMIQKIGIIQAFFHDPDLLILDEPTTGLDPLMQDRFYELLFEEQKRGKTIFISSHNLSEIEKLCSKLAIIRQGKIISVKTMDELKAGLGLVIRISLEKPVDEMRIPGARIVTDDGLEVTLVAEGEISGVLKSLSELPLSGISISRPGLEEVFRNFYREEAHEES